MNINLAQICDCRHGGRCYYQMPNNIHCASASVRDRSSLGSRACSSLGGTPTSSTVVLAPLLSTKCEMRFRGSHASSGMITYEIKAKIVTEAMMIGASKPIKLAHSVYKRKGKSRNKYS